MRLQQDMGPMMGIVGEYTASAASGHIAITPDIYPTIASHQHLDPQQTMLDQYNIMIQQDVDEDDQLIDDDDEDLSTQMHQHMQQNMCVIKTDMDQDEDDSMSHYDQQSQEQDELLDSVTCPIEYQMPFDSDPDNTVPHGYMMQKPVQQTINKKIKPVKRPGLVLKTPIAYQPCLDPSVIPIQRDGMGRLWLRFIICFFLTFAPIFEDFFYDFLHWYCKILIELLLLYHIYLFALYIYPLDVVKHDFMWIFYAQNSFQHYIHLNSNNNNNQ